MNKDEWSKVKEFVKSNIGESAHANWIQPIELKEINGSVAKFKVPTRFIGTCLLYTSPSPRDGTSSRMPSSA